MDQIRFRSAAEETIWRCTLASGLAALCDMAAPGTATYLRHEADVYAAADKAVSEYRARHATLTMFEDGVA